MNPTLVSPLVALLRELADVIEQISQTAPDENADETPAKAAPEADAVEAETEAALTLTDVRRRLAAVVKTDGGRERVRQAVQALGADKLTDVPPSKWSELLEDLNA